MKAFKRRASKEVDRDNLDVMSTPITNYKNRRKLMTDNKIKAKEKIEKLENGDEVDDVLGS